MNLTVTWERRQTSDPRLIALERAVIEEVAGEGFPRASVAGVCERAALPERDFAEHFADLEDAYCEVFYSLVGEIFERSVPFFLAQSGWQDQIRALGYEIFRYLAEDLTRARFIVVEVLDAGERAQSLRERGLDLMVDFIDLGRAEMDDPDSLSRATAEAIGGSVYRSVRVALEGDESLDPFSLLPSLLYTVAIRYVGAAAALRELTIVPPAALMTPGAPADRERLLAAVISEVGETGLESARIEGVCARAGLRPAQFSTCFVDLEDALCKTLEHIDQEIVARIHAALARGGGWREEVRAAAWALAGYLGEDLARARFLLVEAARFGERAHLIRYDALQVAIDLIDQGRQELDDPGSVDREVAARTALALFATVSEALRAPGGGVAERDALIRRLLRDLVEPYVGPEEADRELSEPPR